MQKVMIAKNPYGDTRTTPKDVNTIKLRNASYEHIESVRRVYELLISKMASSAQLHDFTKTNEDESLFHSDFMNTVRNGANFVEGEWYKLHVDKERHHPTDDNHKDDINLFDIIEMITDCVCAGTARSGTIHYPNLSPAVYEKAVENTKHLIEGMVESK